MEIFRLSGHSDMFRDHMIYAAIFLQVVEAKGGKMMSCWETEHYKHVPPLMTGANKVEPSCKNTHSNNKQQ